MKNFYTVAELQERYRIGKQAEINRRKHLGIELAKIEGTRYASQEQVDLMDALNEFLQTPGARMADFDPEVQSVKYSESSEPSEMWETPNNSETPLEIGAKLVPTSDALRTEHVQLTIPWSSESLQEIKKVVTETAIETVAAIATTMQPINPIAHWEKLKMAAEESILLSTSEVRALLGVKPSLKKGSQNWIRGSFVFTKAGKIGAETAWRIEKNF